MQNESQYTALVQKPHQSKKLTPELTFCRINFVNVLMATTITCCCLRVQSSKK